MGLERFLSGINITLFNSNGKMKSFMQIIEELSDIWDILPNQHKEIIAEIIGGTTHEE